MNHFKIISISCIYILVVRDTLLGYIDKNLPVNFFLMASFELAYIILLFNGAPSGALDTHRSHTVTQDDVDKMDYQKNVYVLMTIRGGLPTKIQIPSLLS